MNGFVVSAGVAAYLLPVDVFEEPLVGDETKTLFIPDMTDGVRGVLLTSERARWRDGVFACIAETGRGGGAVQKHVVCTRSMILHTRTHVPRVRLVGLCRSPPADDVHDAFRPCATQRRRRSLVDCQARQCVEICTPGLGITALAGYPLDAA